MNNSRFVVAFNRDRDSYQVPLALHEAGRLEKLFTDLYIPDFLTDTTIPQRLNIAHRYMRGLSSQFVSCSKFALWQQLGPLRFAKDEIARVALFKRLDQSLSLGALSLARSTGADLFLYSGYARECFAAPDMVDRLKMLFVYHPHGAVAGNILDADIAAHPEMVWSYELHRQEIELGDSHRLDAELALATKIICASSFTKKSVEKAGIAGEKISVVPYGCSTTSVFQSGNPIRGRKIRVLFVGQGVQRKGLHHLLKVWERLKHEHAELVVVAQKLDPALQKRISTLGPTVRLVSSLSRQQLDAEFARADIFVMPSLIEGFGLVYLEALSAGCHVIATPNTGVPDLTAPSFAVTLVEPGNLDQLECSLASSMKLVASPSYSATDVRRFAATRSWARFREELRATLS